MDKVDGPGTVVAADGATLPAQMNWHGGDVTVNVGPQHEHRFDDGDHITVHTASGSGQFQVTGTVLLAGQHAALFIQAGEVG